MKKCLFILGCCLVFFSKAASSDGGKFNRNFHLSGFERQFNLYYHTVSDTVIYKDSRDKERSYIRPVNIAIYHILSDTTTYLFERGFGETIEEIYFESHFEDGELFFNGEAAVYSRPIRNHEFLNRDTLLPYLTVITKNTSTEEKTLWRARKDGTELTKLTMLKGNERLMIDVFNQLYLIYRESDDKLEIRQIKI